MIRHHFAHEAHPSALPFPAMFSAVFSVIWTGQLFVLVSCSMSVVQLNVGQSVRDSCMQAYYNAMNGAIIRWLL